MTDAQQDVFLAAADDLGKFAEEYDGDYSGRGMFGKTTRAVVVRSLRDAAVVAHAVSERTGQPFEFRTDNLGHDFIVY